MTNHRASLSIRMDRELTPGGFRLILINSTGGISAAIDPVQVLKDEVLQATGSYQPQVFTYTAGTSRFNQETGWQETPPVTVQFTDPTEGTGYSFTHIALWQGRGATSNKPIASIDLDQDQVIVPAHGLVDGSRGFIRSSGLLPEGAAIQSYYLKSIDIDTLEFYTTADLTPASKVNFSNSGSGSLYLQYADGVIYSFDALNGSVNPGGTKSFTYVHRYR